MPDTSPGIRLPYYPNNYTVIFYRINNQLNRVLYSYRISTIGAVLLVFLVSLSIAKDIAVIDIKEADSIISDWYSFISQGLR